MRQLVRPDVDARAALVTLMDARGALLQLRVSRTGPWFRNLLLIPSCGPLSMLCSGRSALCQLRVSLQKEANSEGTRAWSWRCGSHAVT